MSKLALSWQAFKGRVILGNQVELAASGHIDDRSHQLSIQSAMVPESTQSAESQGHSKLSFVLLLAALILLPLYLAVITSPCHVPFSPSAILSLK